MITGEGAAAVIGKSVHIRGEVKGSEDLMVDGHVEGTITLTESRLTIGPNAHVIANVAARDVVLLGRLSGNVRATGRVELRQGSDLIGDISASRLSIEENAVFRGKVDLMQAATERTEPVKPDPIRIETPAVIPAAFGAAMTNSAPLFAAPVSK